MSNFTKGPWYTSYRQDKSGMYSQAVYDSSGEYICECNWYPVDGGVKEIDGKIYRTTTTNREANAHLIASAPEMYEMLENVLTEYKEMLGMPQEVKGIEQLLAKARGEHV